MKLNDFIKQSLIDVEKSLIWSQIVTVSFDIGVITNRYLIGESDNKTWETVIEVDEKSPNRIKFNSIIEKK